MDSEAVRQDRSALAGLTDAVRALATRVDIEIGDRDRQIEALAAVGHQRNAIVTSMQADRDRWTAERNDLAVRLVEIEGRLRCTEGSLRTMRSAITTALDADADPGIVLSFLGSTIDDLISCMERPTVESSATTMHAVLVAAGEALIAAARVSEDPLYDPFDTPTSPASLSE